MKTIPWDTFQRKIAIHLIKRPSHGINSFESSSCEYCVMRAPTHTHLYAQFVRIETREVRFIRIWELIFVRPLSLALCSRVNRWKYLTEGAANLSHYTKQGSMISSVPGSGVCTRVLDG